MEKRLDFRIFLTTKLSFIASSRRYIWIDRIYIDIICIRAERIYTYINKTPATATLAAAFSSAMGRYSASRHPPPRRPPRSASLVPPLSFAPYRRCFRSTPSILPLTYPSLPTIVAPFSHPLCRFLPLASSSVSTSSSFSSGRLRRSLSAATAASFTLGGLVHRCTS